MTASPVAGKLPGNPPRPGSTGQRPTQRITTGLLGIRAIEFRQPMGDDFQVFVLVEGINRVKKHQRPNPMKNQPGGIIDKEMPIHVSNISLLNPQTQKADRVGFKLLDDGRKVRVFKSNGEMVDA